MKNQQNTKQALSETWAWATEDGRDRRNARACMENFARSRGVDLDNLDAAPKETDWTAFCESLTSTLSKDDSETRECAREWSDSGWYDKSSGDAASMLWRKINPNR